MQLRPTVCDDDDDRMMRKWTAKSTQEAKKTK
jgi:hypothetical protein